MKFDVIIIGAGGGGYPGAFRLARSGYKVALIDPKGELGGNCLFSGCIPSKTVREIAQMVWRVKRILKTDIKTDFSLIQDYKDKVQETRFLQHREELKENPNVTFFKAKAKIKDNQRVILDGNEIEGKYMVIATGSEPIRPNFPGSQYCITSDDLFGYKTPLRKLPEKIIIVGGGYIALETASILLTLGYDVTVLVRGDKVLKGFEPEIVSTLLPLLNLKIMYNSPLLEVKKVKEDEYEVIYASKDGSKKSLNAGLVMLATGRKPVLPEGVENIGLSIDVKGHIVVDEAMRTNIPNVYATGDVNGKAPFFYAAVRMSMAAAYNIMAGSSPTDFVDFKSIPVTIFTIPPAAYVGFMPSDLKRLGIPYVEASYDMKRDAMAQMYDEMEGVVKLYFERGSLRVLGGWVVGVHAGYIINEIGQAVANGLTARDLANFADQHPATNELIAYTARKVV
ncbi:MAG: dihydrolipoyl dehydrogenase [Sulfolobus sp.]